MEQKRRASITAVGGYAPPKIVTNYDLAKIIDTSHDWIVSRTGIEQRHIAEPGVPTSDLAAEAARDLLSRRGISADEIGLIIVATITPDMFFPSTACVVQDKIGASHAWGFDLSAACSGFLYALTVGAQFIETGAHDKVLVIGAEVMSSILNPKDRTTYVLFGDGAGAVLLEPSPAEEHGIFSYMHEIDGSGAPYLNMPAGGSLNPSTHETIDQAMHYVYQDGGQVYKFAVRKLEELSRSILQKNELSSQDIDLFIPHQANIRIINAATDRLGLSERQVVININKYGNTTAGTIPLAMVDALDSGRLRKGDTVLLSAVGAGYTAGAVLLTWAY